MMRSLLLLAAASLPFSAWAETAPEDKTVLEAVVLNIFNGKCIGCHGPVKQKGKLRLDTYEAMLKGGENNKPSVVPKDPATSESLIRTALPEDHDDHMPPKDKPQLTPEDRKSVV